MGFHASCFPFSRESRCVQHYFDMTVPFDAGVFIEGCQKYRLNEGLLPPRIIKAVMESPGGLEVLSGLFTLASGGAPLSDTDGQRLVEAGVPLRPGFGASECGVLMLRPYERPDLWQWLRAIPGVPYEVVEVQKGLFELVWRPNDEWEPNILHQIDGKPGYNTRDVFRRHPTDPTLFKHAGRNDNIIVLSNAENVMAGAIDQALGTQPGIADALSFGQGKDCVGVLLRLTDQPATATPAQLAAARNSIWPTIEVVNKQSPIFARIEKHMIIFAKPEKPFLYTDKGSVRKGPTLELYKDEIEACYEAAEANLNAGRLTSLSPEAVHTFVQHLVWEYAAEHIGDDDNVFTAGGLDSLKATLVRNTLISNLKSLGLVDKAHSVPTGIVYENPTISQLTQKFLQIAGGEGDDRTARVERMLKYLIDNGPTPAAQLCPKGRPVKPTRTVLVTGTTGSLGSYILDLLMKNETVEKVYCLNRAATQPMIEVQKSRFVERGLLVDRDWSKVVFGAMTQDSSKAFDQPTAVQLAEDVDHYILNAWPVNWLISLEECKEILWSMTWLLATAQHGSAYVHFVSTVGTVSNFFTSPSGLKSKATAIPEQHFDDPLVSTASGYGESKFCGERLLKHYSDKYGTQTSVIRPGQISGDTNSGYWLTTESVPILVKTCKTLRLVPDLGLRAAWTPVNQVAEIVWDIARSREADKDGNRAKVFHISNPRLSEPNLLSTAVADFLNGYTQSNGHGNGIEKDEVKIVPAQDWLEAVRSSKHSVEDLPGLKILDFFEGLAQQGKQASLLSHPNEPAPTVSLDFGGLDLKNTVAVSETLRERVKAPDEALLKKYLAYWQSIGYV